MGWVVATNAVPDAQCSPDLLKKLDDEDPDRPEPVKLSTQQRQDFLLATLQKDGGLDHLKEWLPDLAQKAVVLLLEFHHVFSLAPNEIGCMDAMEHVIELMKDEPFKERFWCIAPPLVDEVCQHIQEMLDGGAIRPSQSPWCNAVVLVRKKDGSLRFCINFRRLNAQTKKDAYLLPRMQETMESMVGAWHFFMHGLEEWALASQNGWGVPTIHCLHSGKHGRVWIPTHVLQAVQHPSNVPTPHAKLSGGAKSHVRPNLLGWCDSLLQDGRGTPGACLRAMLEWLMEHGLKLKPSKCNFLPYRN